MEEFKNKSERVKNQEVPPEVDDKIEKIITGQAMVRKPSGFKRFRRSFIAGDASSVGDHVFWNLMVPSAQDALSEMVSTFIDMMIYGEKRSRVSHQAPRTGPGSTSKVNYSTTVGQGSRLVLPPGQNNPNSDRNSRPFTPNDIIVPTRAEAEGVINRMFEVLEKYSSVSVAQLYSMIDVSPDMIDYKFGWTDLSDSDIRRVRHGYLLFLPPVQDIG